MKTFSKHFQALSTSPQILIPGFAGNTGTEAGFLSREGPAAVAVRDQPGPQEIISLIQHMTIIRNQTSCAHKKSDSPRANNWYRLLR